jgi:hypothetical protein
VLLAEEPVELLVEVLADPPEVEEAAASSSQVPVPPRPPPLEPQPPVLLVEVLAPQLPPCAH